MVFHQVISYLRIMWIIALDSQYIWETQDHVNHRLGVTSCLKTLDGFVRINSISGMILWCIYKLCICSCLCMSTTINWITCFMIERDTPMQLEICARWCDFKMVRRFIVNDVASMGEMMIYGIAIKITTNHCYLKVSIIVRLLCCIKFNYLVVI